MREDDMAVAAFAFRTDPSVQYETEGYERLLKQQAFEFVREHPTWYITSVVRRATLFVFPRIGRALFFQPTPEEQQAGFVNHSVGRGIMLAADLLLGLLFLAGIWLFRARWALLMALGIPYLFTLCTLAPFYVTGRNIANIYYVILLVAAAAAAYIFERSRPAAPAV
jgi:hypothetical protein